MGVLGAFFEKLGLLHMPQFACILALTSLGMGSNLRFKPAFNPYTEPSMEVFSYHQGLGKLVEVGNSGVFRPEMLLPMGLPKDVVVIAWGLSLERCVQPSSSFSPSPSPPFLFSPPPQPHHDQVRVRQYSRFGWAQGLSPNAVLLHALNSGFFPNSVAVACVCNSLHCKCAILTSFCNANNQLISLDFSTG